MARISVVVPVVTTEATKLRVGIATAIPTVAAHVSFARVVEAHQAPIVSATCVLPAAAVDYILINTTAYLDSSGRYRLEIDLAVVQDAVTVSLGKAVLDQAYTADSAAFGVDKAFSDAVLSVDSSTLVDGIEYGFQKVSIDTVVPQDIAALGFEKNSSSLTGVSDQHISGVEKNVSEITTVIDTVTRQIAYTRAYDDASDAVEKKYADMALLEPLHDNSAYVLAGYVFAGYVAIDSAFPTDALGGLLQNYVSGDYFLEDYVGAAFGPY